jgi:hypothetical protein
MVYLIIGIILVAGGAILYNLYLLMVYYKEKVKLLEELKKVEVDAENLEQKYKDALKKYTDYNPDDDKPPTS